MFTWNWILILVMNWWIWIWTIACTWLEVDWNGLWTWLRFVNGMSMLTWFMNLAMTWWNRAKVWVTHHPQINRRNLQLDCDTICFDYLDIQGHECTNNPWTKQTRYWDQDWLDTRPMTKPDQEWNKYLRWSNEMTWMELSMEVMEPRLEPRQKDKDKGGHQSINGWKVDEIRVLDVTKWKVKPQSPSI